MFVLPADKDMQVSFYWGNAVPSGLTKSVKETMTINKDTLYFEIKSDGTWQELAHISSAQAEGQKWVRQRIVLSDYK